MKFRIFVLFTAVAVMASCGGSSQTGEACCSSEKTCSQESACCTADLKKIISAQIFIKAEKVDEFLAATKELIELSRAEEGCISYTLYQDPHDSTKFFFFEEWKNQAAVDYHFSTEHFQNFGKILEECASGDPVITIFDSASETKV